MTQQPVDVTFNLDIGQSGAIDSMVDSVNTIVREMKGVANLRPKFVGTSQAQMADPQQIKAARDEMGRMQSSMVDLGFEMKGMTTNVKNGKISFQQTFGPGGEKEGQGQIQKMGQGIAKMIPGGGIAMAFKNLGLIGGIATGVLAVTGFVKGIFQNSKILTTMTQTTFKVLGLMADIIMMPFLPMMISFLLWFIQHGMPLAKDISTFIKDLSSGISDMVEGITDVFNALKGGIGGLLKGEFDFDSESLMAGAKLAGEGLATAFSAFMDLGLAGMGVLIAGGLLTATVVWSMIGSQMSTAFGAAKWVFKIAGGAIAAAFAAAKTAFASIGNLIGGGFKSSGALGAAGKIVGVAAAAWIGWEVGKAIEPWITKNIIDPGINAVLGRTTSQSVMSNFQYAKGEYDKVPEQDLQRIADMVTNKTVGDPFKDVTKAAMTMAAVLQMVDSGNMSGAQAGFGKLSVHESSLVGKLRPQLKGGGGQESGTNIVDNRVQNIVINTFGGVPLEDILIGLLATASPNTTVNELQQRNSLGVE